MSVDYDDEDIDYDEYRVYQSQRNPGAVFSSREQIQQYVSSGPSRRAMLKAEELMERLKNKKVFIHGQVKPSKRKDSRMESIKNGNTV